MGRGQLCLRIQSGRVAYRDSHRIDRLLALGWRANYLSNRERDLPDADLPAYADQPALDRAERSGVAPRMRPGSDAFLTVDGQVGAPLATTGDVVECRVSDFGMWSLVRPPQKTFFDVAAPEAEVG